MTQKNHHVFLLSEGIFIRHFVYFVRTAPNYDSNVVSNTACSVCLHSA